MRRLLATLIVVAAVATPSPASGQASDPPPFRAKVSPIPADIRELMIGRSWHEGCPVPIRDLRLVGLRYWGFDDEAHWGRLVVHTGWGRHVADVFHALYKHRYPVRQIWLVDRYGADDLKSMEHDNTSAFNCRWRAGQPGVWSMHAYGKALDLNPLENPYVRGSHVSPPGGRKYLDRSKHAKGMIHAGDVAVRAFHDIGWEWGGAWTGNEVDYQHFSTNGH